jgi:hypothetical protein
MKYRKKPVVIEAIRYDLPLSEMTEALLDFGFGIVGHNGNKIVIPTLEGVMNANPGDYIIKGIKGEFYPCKSDIFEATYEKVVE